MDPYLSRNLETGVRAALGDTRVVFIAGPRQAGKSTLAAQATSGRPGAAAVTLDDPAIRDAAAADPIGFVANREGTVIIDEVQHVSELGDAIKMVVDRDGRPGQFLLTGSAGIDTIPAMAQALVGRMEVLTLYPFSQGELVGVREGFIDRLFESGPDPAYEASLSRADYISRVVMGGYPEVIKRGPSPRRSRWFHSYVNLLIHRDLTALADLDRLGDIPILLKLVAARTSAPLNLTALARDAKASDKTIRHWLRLLAQLYLVRMVPAWSNNPTSRSSLAPTINMVDTGLAAYLVGVNEHSFTQPTMDIGPLLENFVAMELLKQLGWSRTEAELFHYRTRDGQEVDCVLEAMDRRIVGLEVKAAMTVRTGDFSGLRHLKRAAGENFVCGVILHAGRRSLSFGDGMWAVPIAALWASSAG